MVFNVEYQASFGGSSNKELKGRGQLTISSDGPVYEFTGLRRRLLSSERITVVFGADDIANVTVDGRCIRFSARPRAPGGSIRPFEFYLRDEAEARVVAALLPRHLLEGFVESHDFIAKLNALAGPRPAWASVTRVIIVLNAIAFVILAGVLGAGWITVDSIMPYMLYGANNGGATTDGEWWRLFTSLFMHYGLLHVGLNMWALFNTGPLLEKLQGRTLFALTYLGSGVAGGFASILWNGDKVWSAGASGAVFGVIGGIIGFMLREKHSVPKRIAQGILRSSLTFAVLNIMLGLSIKGIDNSAHLGGLASGIALGWLLAMPVDREARRRLFAGRVATALVALAVLVGAGVSFTPRFNYRVSDEIAWENANRDFAQREIGLVKEQNTTVAALNREGDAAAHAEWIERNLTPFYTQWRDRLVALDLAPGLRTDGQRRKLVEILQLKLDAYAHLSDAVRANRPDALEQYARDEARIEEKIRSLNGGD